MLTTQQAAQRRGVAPVTVRKWILRGLLGGHKVGRDWLIEEAALDAFTPPKGGRPPKPKFTHPAARPPRAANVPGVKVNLPGEAVR